MSNNDSIDEETKRILAEVDSDDSKESIPKKPAGKVYKNDDFNEYDISDDKELDDSDW